MAIGFAVDKGDDGHKLKLSMQVLVPQKIEQESSVKDPTKIIETSGDSIHQIFRTTALKNTPHFCSAAEGLFVFSRPHQ